VCEHESNSVTGRDAPLLAMKQPFATFCGRARKG
jgi:hypothetical protein